MIGNAGKAAASGMPEQAIKKWQDVLEIIPRHKVALEQIQKLGTLLADFKKRHQEATVRMDEGEFAKADQLFQTCLELIPARKDIKEMLETCRKRAEHYKTSFEEASDAARNKLLEKANTRIKNAIAQAPKNSNAKSLSADIAQKLEKTKQLIGLVRRQLSYAEFSEVGNVKRSMK